MKNGSNRCSSASGARPGPVSATLARIARRAGSSPGRQAEGPAGRHGLDGVGGQVAEDLQQGRRGHRDRRQIGIELDLDADALCLGGRRGQPGGFGQHRVQVAGRQVLGVGSRELEKARDDLFEAIHLVDEPAERLVVEPDDAALPELGRRADAGQRVADLVRDAGQQLAQGRQPLAPPQLGLEPVALGRLPADGPRQARGERERQGDPPEGQTRGQPITLKRAVDEQRVDQPGHHPGGPDDRARRPSSGAVRMATVTGRSPSSSSTENSTCFLRIAASTWMSIRSASRLGRLDSPRS